MPSVKQACFNMRAVVLLPIAQSIPITATIGAATLNIAPSQKCKSALDFGFLTSINCAPVLAASVTKSALSFKYSCNPFTTEMPFLTAS